MNNIYLKELDDKAFQLLPHVYKYDNQRQVIGVVLWDEDPGWTYEDFKWELDIHLGNEDERAILKLSRKLERIENVIFKISIANFCYCILSTNKLFFKNRKTLCGYLF